MEKLTLELSFEQGDQWHVIKGLSICPSLLEPATSGRQKIYFTVTDSGTSNAARTADLNCYRSIASTIIGCHAKHALTHYGAARTTHPHPDDVGSSLVYRPTLMTEQQLTS
eukprot:3161451-Amphidinium_carterae.1